MKLKWLCCFCVFLVNTAHCAVYKRIEADGSVVYTDTPGHNTEPVDLNTLSNNIIPWQPPLNPDTPNAVAHPVVNYQLLITSPSNNATIRDNSGRIHITGIVTPQISGNYELRLNGEIVDTQSTPHFVLENVPRGEYSIQIELKNNKGKIIASSRTIKAYLHRASVLNRAN